MKKQLHLLVLGAVIVAIGACNYLTGQYVDARATVWLLGADKVPYRVTVQLYARQTVDVNGTRESVREGVFVEKAVVSVARCPSYKCLSATPYVVTVAAKTASSKAADPVYDDSDAKKLTLSLAGWGGTLKVTWNDRPQGYVDGAPSLTGDDDVESTGTATSATQVTFLGVTCTDPKGVVVRHTTVSPLGISQALGKKIPLLATPDLPRKPRCTAAH